MRCSLIPARSKTGPVVKIDDTNLAFGRNDTVAAINLNLQHLGRTFAYSVHILHRKGNPGSFTVNLLVSEFTVIHIKRIKPIEEITSGHTVKLNQVAHQVLVYHCIGNTTQGIFAQDT